VAELKINGKNRLVDVEEDTPLLWAIRDTVGLTGTKYGCGIQQCGACTVLIGKRPVRSCGITVGEVAGKQITTIEGLSEDSKHPVQMAWVEEQVPQLPVGTDHGSILTTGTKPKPNGPGDRPCYA